jgi:hypothetical protein
VVVAEAFSGAVCVAGAAVFLGVFFCCGVIDGVTAATDEELCAIVSNEGVISKVGVSDGRACGSRNAARAKRMTDIRVEATRIFTGLL